MYVKYEGEEIVSLFVGCVPDDPEGYVEVPDDEAAIQAYVDKHKAPQPLEPTQEERIKALEEQLAAYERAYAEGVAEA